MQPSKQVLRDMLSALVANERMVEPIEDLDAAGKVLQDMIGYGDEERFAAIFVDQGRREVGRHIFEGGSRTRTTLYPRLLFKMALECDATGIVIAHNHPSGNPLPSPQDRELTRRVGELGQSLEAHLLDHFIVTSQDIVSFKKRGWL